MKIAQNGVGRNEGSSKTSDSASDATARATGTINDSSSSSPEAFTSADGDVGPFTIAGSVGIESRNDSVGDELMTSSKISNSTSEHGDDDSTSHGNNSDETASVETIRRLHGGNSNVSMVSISKKLRDHENGDAMFLRQQSWLEIVRDRILRHGIESVNDDPFAPEEEVVETAKDGPLPLRNEVDRTSRND